MERFSHWLAWTAVALIMLFSGLNWTALTAPTSLNLLVAQVYAPLGVILLGLTGVFVALFFIATLYTRVAGLLESRRMLKELQRVQEMADKAESSRMASMHQMISTEFRQLNERLTRLESLDSRPLVKLT